MANLTRNHILEFRKLGIALQFRNLFLFFLSSWALITPFYRFLEATHVPPRFQTWGNRASLNPENSASVSSVTFWYCFWYQVFFLHWIKRYEREWDFIWSERARVQRSTLSVQHSNPTLHVIALVIPGFIGKYVFSVNSLVLYFGSLPNQVKASNNP